MWKSVLPLMKAGLIKGGAHITGGGLIENPPRCIAEGLVPRFDWEAWTLPPVFDWLQKTGGVSDRRAAPHLQLRHRLPAHRRPRGRPPLVMAALLNAGEEPVVVGELSAG